MFLTSLFFPFIFFNLSSITKRAEMTVGRCCLFRCFQWRSSLGFDRFNQQSCFCGLEVTRRSACSSFHVEMSSNMDEGQEPAELIWRTERLLESLKTESPRFPSGVWAQTWSQIRPAGGVWWKEELWEESGGSALMETGEAGLWAAVNPAAFRAAAGTIIMAVNTCVKTLLILFNFIFWVSVWRSALRRWTSFRLWLQLSRSDYVLRFRDDWGEAVAPRGVRGPGGCLPVY